MRKILQKCIATAASVMMALVPMSGTALPTYAESQELIDLTEANVDDYAVLLRVGNYGIVPGGTIDLAEKGYGSGTITFGEDAGSITLHYVDISEENMPETDAKALITLIQTQSGIDSYRVVLDGENTVTGNTAIYLDLRNEAADIVNRGEAQPPSVSAEGDGSLKIVDADPKAFECSLSEVYFSDAEKIELVTSDTSPDDGTPDDELNNDVEEENGTGGEGMNGEGGGGNEGQEGGEGQGGEGNSNENQEQASVYVLTFVDAEQVSGYPEIYAGPVLVYGQALNADAVAPKSQTEGRPILGYTDESGVPVIVLNEETGMMELTESQYFQNGIFVGSDNLVLYAYYPAKYQLIVNANEGTFSDGSGAATSETRFLNGDDYSWFWLEPSCMPTREGHVLTGFTDADGNMVLAADGGLLESPYFSNGTFIGNGDLTVFARWTPNKRSFTLTYDANGGTQVSAEQYEEGSAVDITAETYRDGFTFDGWFTGLEDGEQVASLTMDSDKTVYAHWTEIPAEPVYYTLTFDSNGGAAVEAASYEEGTAVETLPETTREGFTFDGWFTGLEDGEQVTSITMDADKTVYAHWTEIPAEPVYYTLTFDSNGGSAVETASYEEGTAVETLPETTREGFTFDGWFTGLEDGEQVTSITMDSDKTVYAHWTETPAEPVYYTLTFDSNGGAAVEAASYEEGTAVETLPEATRDGFTFDGWFTGLEDGEQVTSLTMDADKTVYAHWTEIPAEPVYYTLTYDSNGGAPVEAAQYEAGTEAEVRATTSRDGYMFLGWFPEAEGGESMTSITMDSDKTVYAHWTPSFTSAAPAAQYTLTYDTNGGAPLEAAKYEAGKSVEINAVSTREGYMFLGWFTEAEGGEQVATLVMDGDKTVYAHWKDKTAAPTETASSSGEDVISGSSDNQATSSSASSQAASSSSETASSSSETAISSSSATAASSTSGTEQTSSSSAGSTSESQVTPTGAAPSQAPATPPAAQSYTVTYDANGGTHVPAEQYKPGANVRLDAVTVREGYSFLGWYTKPDGGFKVEMIAVNNDITVYAHWKNESQKSDSMAKYVLTYDANGGTSVPSQEYLNGAIVKPSVIPTRQGYVFLGWYSAKNGGGQIDSILMNGDKTIYALWAPMQTTTVTPTPTTSPEQKQVFIITFDANGGTAVKPQAYNAGEIVKVNPATQREGYKFLGWFYSREGGYAVSSLMMDADKTLYAHWEPLGTATPTPTPLPQNQQYTLTFDANGGTPVNPQAYLAGTYVGVNAVTQRQGYTFLGWFDQPDGGNRVTAIMMDMNKMLYAHWADATGRVVPYQGSNNINNAAQNGNAQQNQPLNAQQMMSVATADSLMPVYLGIAGSILAVLMIALARRKRLQ